MFPPYLFKALILGLFLSPLAQSRSVVKRSPQLSLTVLEEPSTTPREHPPSVADLEARRQALIEALNPSSLLGGVSGGVQSLSDLGLDLVGGVLQNTGELFAPLRNATRNAKQGFPRVGTVINRLTDNARKYRAQVAGGLRETASVTVNNAIRVFTTASARGSEVIGGVFRLIRTLLDNFTLVINGLVQKVSRGLQSATSFGTRFLARNFQKARTVLESGRLVQPAKDVISIGTNLARGLADDFTQAQSWVSEGVKSKINLGNNLIPRVALSSILSPVADIPSEAPSDDAISGGYSSKRESEGESASTSKSQTSDVPEDILQLLASSNTETSVKSESTKVNENPIANEVSNIEASEKSAQEATTPTSTATPTSTSTTPTTTTSTAPPTSTSTAAPTTTTTAPPTSTSTAAPTTTTTAPSTSTSTAAPTTTTTTAPPTSTAPPPESSTTTKTEPSSTSSLKDDINSSVEKLFGLS